MHIYINNNLYYVLVFYIINLVNLVFHPNFLPHFLQWYLCFFIVQHPISNANP